MSVVRVGLFVHLFILELAVYSNTNNMLKQAKVLYRVLASLNYIHVIVLYMGDAIELLL